MPRRHQDEDEYEEEPEEEEEQEDQQEDNEEENIEEDAEEVQLWRYSTCAGNKKALLIGINYFGQDAPLSGCINDVENVKNFLLERGYEEENMRIMTDDQDPDSDLYPTRENIIASMEWLIEDASEDDALFLHYSGHGTSLEDENGDEHDWNDEAICPVDGDTAGFIVDDQLHDILVKPLPIGCRLTVIFDCCHSGSALDLPYMYNDEGTIKAPSVAEHQEALEHHVSRGDVDAIVKAAQALKLAQTGYAQKVHKHAMATKTHFADVIFLSGCRDEQVSADATIDDEPTGALSHAFIRSLNEEPDLTYKELLHRIREILEEEYSQKPQLSSSHPIDIDLQFVC